MAMENGVTGARYGEVSRRAWTKDSVGAVALAEGAMSAHVLVALPSNVAVAERNAFDEPVQVERAPAVAACAARFAALLEQGKRVALVASAHDLAGSREILAAMHAQRVGTVVHAIAERGASDAWALADLGWGVLFASSVEESIDLALVARRASEDSGTPFFVVHERQASVRHVEAALAPSRELVSVFVGAPRGRVTSNESVRPPTSERAFSERVQFALGSAMRELESLTGRRHDVFERLPAGDTPAVLVALGELGDSAIAGVERLRANGHDVGAIKLVALRPFPGPRLVKAMQRALAITVLETTDAPLAQSNPLTRELKAAFADAITWAPEYPGIGRIPRIASGVVAANAHALEVEDLDAIVHNMHADERGRRSFVLGQGEPLASAGVSGRVAADALSMRGLVRDAATAEASAELCAAVVSSALGLHVRGSVRRASPFEGGGHAFDVLAARDRPRGAHAPHAVRLVALDDASLLERSNPLARLAESGVLAVPSVARSADAVWGEVPAYAKAIVFDRGARVVGFDASGAVHADGDPRQRAWMVASVFAGLALAVGSSRAHPVDASLVARETAEALRAALAPSEEAWIARGADAARRAFEAHVDVPRATVERDGESIRAGRRDARISNPPK